MMKAFSRLGWELLLLTTTIVVVVVVVAQQQDAISTECADGSVGISSLTDLRALQLAERQAILDGTREAQAPFVYTLCPDTTYTVSSFNDTIFSVLSLSIFRCGESGTRDGNCVVQVDSDLFEPNDVEAPPHVLIAGTTLIGGITQLEGFTFVGSKGISILTVDPYPDQVVFLDCHWVDNQGSEVVSNALNGDVTNLNFPFVGQWAMIHVYQDCTFESSDVSGAVIASTGGLIILSNTVMKGNKATFSYLGQLDQLVAQDLVVQQNSGTDGLLSFASILTVVNSQFLRNKFDLGSSITMSQGIANITSTSFKRTSATSDLSVLTADAILSNVVFAQGKYIVGPAYVTGTSNLLVTNDDNDAVTFARNKQLTKFPKDGPTTAETFCPDSAFFANAETDSCFGTTTGEPPEACVGVCVPLGQSLDTCADKDDFFFKQERRNCKFVSKRTNFCKKQLQKKPVYLSCPIACGLCGAGEEEEEEEEEEEDGNDGDE